MPDEPIPERDDDRSDGPEPADADLIAYLDGELDRPESADIEERLALDPTARSKAEVYKKTYDLLDYLPKREPSADFTTRTLTRLYPVPGSTSASGIGVRGLQSSATPVPRTRNSWLLPGLAAAVLALVGGLAAHAGLRPLLNPPERLDLDDLRVIEHLPLYAAVDDLEYLRRLDDPDLFAPELVVVTPVTGALVSVNRPDASPADRDRLIALFRQYPVTRQQQLRQLHQQLEALPVPERDQLGRVLEAYALWVDRLSDDDRRKVFAASNSEARLLVVSQLKEEGWRRGLPVSSRELLKRTANPEEVVRLAAKWTDSERNRREEWQLARRQWESLHGPDRKPWPFHDPALVTQVDDYVKSVLKVDLTARFEPKREIPASWRVTWEEFQELKLRHQAAEKDGNWFLYGLILYRLDGKRPSLPEPADRPPVTEALHVRELIKDFKPRAPLAQIEKRWRGKWPEFALEVATASQRMGAPVPKGLGPARPEEFKPPVAAFLTGVLEPRLTPAERNSLDKLQGKWPDYPRRMIELAVKYDEPVPGVTLPGKPSLWAKYYSLSPSKASR